MADKLKAWDKMPEENFRQYAAFALYRDLGPTRTIVHVRRETKYGRGAIDDISVRYSWKSRAEAYDAYLDSLRQAATKVQVHNMAQRQAALGQRMQLLADKRLAQFEDKEELQATMTVSDVAKLAAEGVRIERLAEGESTSNEGQQIIFALAGPALPKWAPKSLAITTIEATVVEENVPNAIQVQSDVGSNAESAG